MPLVAVLKDCCPARPKEAEAPALNSSIHALPSLLDAYTNNRVSLSGIAPHWSNIFRKIRSRRLKLGKKSIVRRPAARVDGAKEPQI
jgi:hypothetical protein